MILETNIGNFGTFKDLEMCMRFENHNTVLIHKADWWGVNLKLMDKLELTYDEVVKILNDEV